MNRIVARGALRAALLCGLLGASGCGGVTAVADGVDSVGSLVAGTPAEAARPVRLFVASTRPDGTETAGSVEVASHFSLATISVPPGHKPGSIERPGLGSENKLRHFATTGERALDETGFRDEVATHLSGRIGSSRDVLLFVHGFNTNFDEARFRLAQIVADGGFGGVPVLFTWPSRGSLFAYNADRESALASRDALERVLLLLAREPDIGRIQILAHSMGAALAMEALRDTAIGGHPDLDGHLGDILLAAPDIDLAVFRQEVERLGSYAHITVFAADNDRALDVSGALADRPRVGALDASKASDRQVLEASGVRVVDISREGVNWVGHGTYAASPAIVRGIGADLATPRSEDRETQAVLDGTEPAAGPPGRSPVRVSPLPPFGSPAP